MAFVELRMSDLDPSLDVVLARYSGRPLTPDTILRLKVDVMTWSAFHEVPRPTLHLAPSLGYLHVGVIDAQAFRLLLGRAPEGDELHRVNCEQAGMVGHFMCGWCEDCDSPRFVCGHLAQRGDTGMDPLVR